MLEFASKHESRSDRSERRWAYGLYESMVIVKPMAVATVG